MTEPERQLDDMQARLERLRRDGRSTEVLVRYEREVRRLEQWIAAGARIAPAAHPPDGPFDPITYRTLLYGIAREVRGLDRRARFRTVWNAMDVGFGPACASLPWPGSRLVVGVGPEADEAIVDQLVVRLLPAGTERRAEIVRQLHEIADAQESNYERVARLITVGVLRNVLDAAGDEWTGRVGSGDGSGQVTGLPRAGALGLAYHLQAEVRRVAGECLVGPRRCRRSEELSGDALDDRAIGSLDADAGLAAEAAEAIERGIFDDAVSDDRVTARLAIVLRKTGGQRIGRLVLCARARPERYSIFVQAAELAGTPLTAEETSALEAELPTTAEETAVLIGLTGPNRAQQVRNHVGKLKKILSDLGE